MSEREQEIGLGIVLNKNGEVLIIERAKEEKGGDNVTLSWAFPGGKIEEGETKEIAVQREVYEETGYRIEVVSVISERRHPQFPVYIYYLECKLKDDTRIGSPQDEEIRQMIWVSPSKLDNYFTTDIDKKVAEYLGIR